MPTLIHFISFCLISFAVCNRLHVEQLFARRSHIKGEKFARFNEPENEFLHNLTNADELHLCGNIRILYFPLIRNVWNLPFFLFFLFSFNFAGKSENKVNVVFTVKNQRQNGWQFQRSHCENIFIGFCET